MGHLYHGYVSHNQRVIIMVPFSYSNLLWSPKPPPPVQKGKNIYIMGIQLIGAAGFKPSLRSPEVSPNHPKHGWKTLTILEASKQQAAAAWKNHWALLNSFGYAYHFKNIFKLTITRVIHHWTRAGIILQGGGGWYHPGSFFNVYLPALPQRMSPSVLETLRRATHVSCRNQPWPRGVAYQNGISSWLTIKKWDFTRVYHEKLGFNMKVLRQDWDLTTETCHLTINHWDLIKDSTQNGDLTILNNTYPPVSSIMAMENTLFIGFYRWFAHWNHLDSSGFPIATFDDTGG